MESQKNKLLKQLKDEIISDIKNDVVENYDIWKNKLRYSNFIISAFNPKAEKYSYNEYCKKILEYTIEYFDCLKFDDFCLTDEEIDKLITENITKDITSILQDGAKEKYCKKRVEISQFYTMKCLKFKIGEAFPFIKNTLEEFVEYHKQKNNK